MVVHFTAVDVAEKTQWKTIKKQCSVEKMNGKPLLSVDPRSAWFAQACLSQNSG